MSTTIQLEFTPNPDTLKYSVSQPLMERGAAFFKSAEEVGDQSELASMLFEIDGICAVMIGTTFVTVTVSDPAKMPEIHPAVMQRVPAHLDAGKGIVSESWHDADHTGDHDGVSQQIIGILDEQIRPAVAMDGGDIVFDRFENGVVYLELKGSCHGCPSSMATLKQGIEVRLRQAIPEVLEVQAV